MINDPIVEEVRKIREQLFAEADYDLGKYVESLRISQMRHPPERIVTLEEFRRRREERKQREGGK